MVGYICILGWDKGLYFSQFCIKQTIKRKPSISQSEQGTANQELNAFLTQSPPNQKSVKYIILYHTKNEYATIKLQQSNQYMQKQKISV